VQSLYLAPYSARLSPYKALYFQVLALKQACKILPRGATPFRGYSPVIIGRHSLKTLVVTTLLALKRYGCPINNAKILEVSLSPVNVSQRLLF